ncbi:hypothetical protein BaRGS_00031192, partial [Batillaria attramentaria]
HGQSPEKKKMSSSLSQFCVFVQFVCVKASGASTFDLNFCAAALGDEQHAAALETKLQSPEMILRKYIG